jgi:hypothetical protein
MTDEAMVEDEGRMERGWRRAAGLFLLAVATSVAPPGLLVAVPLLVLLSVSGIRSGAAFAVTVVAMLVVLTGPRDGLWFAERGWAMLAGGAFAALSLAVPGWRLTSRSLVAVTGAMVVCVIVLASGADAWASIDWGMGDRLRAGFATWLDAMQVLRGGDPVPAATVTAAFATAEALVAVFPAVVALQSMATLAVAWWIYVRLVYRRDDGVGALGAFRFNDHLVWLMIVGLCLVVFRTGDGVTRFGANLAVFMGALYTVRGLGVVSFVSGGVSFLRGSLMVLAFLFAAPVVVGFTLLLGIADTWLDVRTRVGSMAA